MATMALPIRELELSVCVGTEKARVETECVVFYSRARANRPSIVLTAKLGFYLALLKWLLASLARGQRTMIRLYQNMDFTCYSNAEIVRLAASLYRLVERGRETLSKLQTLGPRAHACLGAAVLVQLAEQLEHLDSIAESLHIAADDEATALMAMAVEEFSAVRELAAQ